MSCDITHGRAEVCKDVVGGLQAIYIANFGITSADVTYDVTNTDMITDINNITNLYKFELKGANSFEQTIQSSRENGTTFFEQVLNIKLKKQDVSTSKTLKLLSYGRPHVIVKDNNNNYFIMGLLRGADVTAGKIASGTNLGDMSGYELTFTAQEATYANFLNCSSDTALATLFSGATIVTS